MKPKQKKNTSAARNGLATIADFAKLDLHRGDRTGIPEAVFAEGKTPEQVVKILARLTEKSGLALATRVSDEIAQYVKRKLGRTFALEFNSVARTVVARRRSSQLSALSRQRSKTPPLQNSTTPLKFPPSALRLPPSISRSHGCIAILAAGTADVRVAEEAAVSAEAMGCRVLRFYDVGIAGLHRLLEPIRQIQENQVACVVACAGMEGALPSVVRGLIAIPVIGVPVSTGYGYGGKGQAALMTMLQSCSPGLTVVNIDNGFGAGATAALIAFRK